MNSLFLLLTTSRDKSPSGLTGRWLLRLSRSAILFELAADLSHPRPHSSMVPVCSRAIFSHAPAGCICSWRSFCRNHIYVAAATCAVCAHAAKGSPMLWRACSTSIVSTCCSHHRRASLRHLQNKFLENFRQIVDNSYTRQRRSRRHSN